MTLGGATKWQLRHDMNPLTLSSKFAMAVTAGIALSGAVYVAWFYFAVLVLYPNKANYSPFGLAILSIMLALAISNAAMARLVWNRIDGRSVGSAKIHVLAVVTVLLSLPPALLSPTTIGFVILVIFLLLLNWKFGRSPDPNLVRWSKIDDQHTAPHLDLHPLREGARFNQIADKLSADKKIDTAKETPIWPGTPGFRH